MKKYVTPETEFFSLCQEDVLTTSSVLKSDSGDSGVVIDWSAFNLTV